MPIIWWFITHCRLVDDDPPHPPSPPAPTPLAGSASPGSDSEAFLRPITPRPDILSTDPQAAAIFGDGSLTERGDEDAPTVISVQAFTPILGTLLLSPNGIVGGSARYAVVELLRRLRRADDREDGVGEFTGSPEGPTSSAESERASSPTPSQVGLEESDALDVGLFQRAERRMFEHELVYQVVIGMGRLDIDDGRMDQHPEGLESEDTSDSGPSTAVPTPQPTTSAADADSYFPPAVTFAFTAPTAPIAAAASPPAQTIEPPAAASTAPTSTLSPGHSPSPPVSSTSSLLGSPDHSSSSTPSLTSSTSSSSGEYPEASEPIGTDPFGRSVVDGLPIADAVQGPQGMEKRGPVEFNHAISYVNKIKVRVHGDLNSRGSDPLFRLHLNFNF